MLHYYLYGVMFDVKGGYMGGNGAYHIKYLTYIESGRWLCSHFQLETPLNFHKPITQKLYNLEK